MPKDTRESSKSSSKSDKGKKREESKDKAQEKTPKAGSGGGGASEKPALAAKIIEVRDTYGKMAAKARGVRLHPGPLKLRRSLPPRDCTSWVREDKTNNPYSYFECPGNKPSPMPPKSKGPPPLWLPPRAKDPKPKDRDDRASPKKGGEKEKQLTDYDENTLGRPPWDTEHHVKMSRMNDEVQVGVREYFDVPKRKEGEGIPKMKERYVMSDRQLGWNDEPMKPGEMRRTLFGNIGPYNLGGCRVQQLPSYWRKVKDWGSYSTPEMPTMALSGSKNGPGMDKKSLLQALANTPAPEARNFWRGWAETGNNFKKAVEETSISPLKSQLERVDQWDNAWNVTWSQGNHQMNARCREYFSVPLGGTGRSTEGPRSPASLKNPLAATFAESMNSLNMGDTIRSLKQQALTESF